jgi:hypothetical protein
MSRAILGARRYRTVVVASGIVTATIMIVNADIVVDSHDGSVVIPGTRIVHDAIRLVSRAQLMVYPTDTINSATQRINDYG